MAWTASREPWRYLTDLATDHVGNSGQELGLLKVCLTLKFAVDGFVTLGRLSNSWSNATQIGSQVRAAPK